MKRLVLCSLLVIMGVMGCTYADPNPPRAMEPTPTYYYGDPSLPTTVSDNSSPIVADNKIGGSVLYNADKPTSGSSTAIEARMIDVNWISPGKVTISNLYKGAQAEYTLRIHNGSSDLSVFMINVRQPDGYGINKLPLDCLNWVSIPAYSIVVQPKGTYELPITVKMLTDTNMKGKDYEVWISVIDSSQKGMVQTELCSRWLISTRK
jgi:hypothetical protein